MNPLIAVILESGVNFSVSLHLAEKRHLYPKCLQQSFDFHKRSLRRLSPPAVLAYEFGLVSALPASRSGVSWLTAE
jgi:hypothetical protein